MKSRAVKEGNYTLAANLRDAEKNIRCALDKKYTEDLINNALKNIES